MKFGKQNIKTTFNKLSFTKLSSSKKLMVIILIISIPNLLIGLMVYIFGAQSVKDHLIENHESQIRSQIEYIDEQLQNLEVSLNYASYEPLFNENFTDINFQQNYHLANDITSSLFSKQYNNTLIERFHFFIDDDDPKAFNPQFRWTSDTQLVNYRRYFNFEEDFYWDRNLFRGPDDQHVFPLVLVKKIPQLNQSSPTTGFIVELNQNSVIQLLDNLTLSDDGTAFFVDERTGLIISSNQTNQYLEDIVSEEYVENESRLIDRNNEQYSMISGSINRVSQNWRYVSLVPISSIIEPVTTLSIIIIVASITGILLSFLISSLTMNKLFKPLKNMASIFKQSDDIYNLSKLETDWKNLTDSKTDLENKVSKLNNMLINSLLYKFIRGFITLDEEAELEERLRSIQTKDLNYVYLDTKIENNVYKLVFKKKVSNLKNVDCYLIDFNEKYRGYVLVFENNTEINEELSDSFDSFIEEIGFENTENIVIYKSVSCHTLNDLRKAVTDIKNKKYNQTSHHTEIMITDMDDVESVKEDESVLYPSDVEKQIIETMRFGNHYEIEERIDLFISEIKTSNKRMIQDYFIHLYTSITNEISNQGYSQFEIVKDINLIEQIINGQTKNELKNIIINFILIPFFNVKDNKSNSQKSEVIKETIKIIEENYDDDISLDECASRLNITPYTLSKWFKDVVGKNFIDYLTDYRLNKAKQLLIETDIKVGEIAQLLGYQNSYFNRIFKKHTGETPGKYRNKMKKN